MNNTFTEECKVHSIGPLEYIPTKNGGNLEKRVVTFSMVKLNDHENRFPQPAYPDIQFIGGRCKHLDGISVGDMVTVTFTFVTRIRKDGQRFNNIVGESIYKGYHYTGGPNEG